MASLLEAGHELRLLVRRPARVATALVPVGVDPAGIDVVVGDVLDDASVTRAVADMDAVINAANVAALLPAQHFSPDTDPGRPRGPYCRSKAEAERIVLALRAGGARRMPRTRTRARSSTIGPTLLDGRWFDGGDTHPAVINAILGGVASPAP